MNKAVKRIMVVTVLVSIFFLAGCWDQKIFEDIGFILQLGFELNEDDELLYSLTMPVVEEEIEQKIEILSITAPLLRESRDRIRNFSGKRIEGGKTQQINFSKELAEKGVGDILDVFVRSPENPMLANIIVVDGSPLEMFEKSLGYKDKTRVAFYILNLIEDARKRTATPETRIYNFEVLRHSGTIDPTATYIRYDDEKIEVIGTALFKGDKMVGDLDITESGILYSLMGEKINFGYYYRETDMHSQSAGKNGMALLFKLVKWKMKINKTYPTPKISLNLDYVVTLEEYDDRHNLDESKSIDEIGEKVAKSLKKDCEEILKYLQKIGSDPIGFEEIFRSKHNEYYKSIDWDKIYPDIEFSVETKVNIEFHGAIN